MMQCKLKWLVWQSATKGQSRNGGPWRPRLPRSTQGIMKSVARSLLRYCIRPRSHGAQFAVDSLVSPSVYMFIDKAVLGRGAGLHALEEIVVPVLKPGEPGAVDLHEVEDNIRFRSWVRNAFLEQRFGQSPKLRMASQRFYEAWPRVPTMREMNEVFGTTHWNRHPEESENALQKRLVEVYEKDPKACADWNLETILETIGCCVAGMNEFNLYCERHFVYEFLTKDYVNALSKHIRNRCEEIYNTTGQTEINILEVGAGTGQLTWLLDRAHSKTLHSKSSQRPWTCKYIATDTGTWSTRHQKGSVQELQTVERMEYKSALAKFNPSVVLCSWMPLGEDWTDAIRQTSSVQEYILIGETDDGCCGHPWKTWGVHVHKSNDPMFAKNREKAKFVDPERSVDLFHWLGRGSQKGSEPNAAAPEEASDAENLDPEPEVLVPPYAADGFTRQNLPLSDLQLSRYDRAHYAANSHTVSFSRQ